MKKTIYLFIALAVATTTATSSLVMAQPNGPSQIGSVNFATLLDHQKALCLAHNNRETCREQFYDVEGFAQKLQVYVIFGSAAVPEQSLLHAFFDQPNTLQAKAEIVPAATHFTRLTIAQYNRAKKFEFDAHERMQKARNGKAHDRLLKIEFAAGGAVIAYFVGMGVFVDESAATALGLLGSLLGYGTGAGVLAYQKHRLTTCSDGSTSFDPELCLIKR